MAKKTATSTTLVPKGKGSDNGVGELVPYNRGELCKGMLQPFNGKDHAPDPRAPKAPTRTEGWKEVKTSFPPTFHFTKVGDYVSGKYVEKRDNVGVNESEVYVIEVGNASDAERVSVWEKTALKSKMASIELGAEILIQLVAMKPGQFGVPYYDFRVLQK